MSEELARFLSGARLERPLLVHAAWAGPLAALVLIWAAARARDAVRRFRGGARGRHRSQRVVGRAVLAGLAVSLVAVAASGPQHSPEPVTETTRGREVAFLIDVSRSMLARDLTPSRLGRAKLWIGDLAESLEGDRVAVVAFAGTSRVLVPLTRDRGFFRLVLEELGPDSVDRGGTLIGDAIRRTLDTVFSNDEDADAAGSEPVARDIILITDGEDHESLPVEAAALADEMGVRIIAIGIGSPDGAIVPAGSDERAPATYAGGPVRSALDERALARIASQTRGGAFLPVGTGEIDLPAAYARLTRDAGTRAFGEVERVRHEEAYQWFLGAAVALLLGEMALAGRGRRRAPMGVEA